MEIIKNIHGHDSKIAKVQLKICQMLLMIILNCTGAQLGLIGAQLLVIVKTKI